MAPGVYSKRGFGGSAEYRYILSQERKRRHERRLRLRELQEWRPPGLRERQARVADHARPVAHRRSERGVRRQRPARLRVRAAAARRAARRVQLLRHEDVDELEPGRAASTGTRTSRPPARSRSSGCPRSRSRVCARTCRDCLAFYQVDSSAVYFLRDIGSEGARFDVHPVVSRPIPLAGYLTVTPFVGGRATAYSTTVIGSHVPLGGGPSIEDTNGEWRVRELLEYGSDAESRASRVYPLGGLGGFSALLHSIEPRAHYIRIVGHNFSSLPQWTNIDLIPEANWFEYSLTNRLRARTVSSDDAEATRLDLIRVVVANAYDYQAGRFGNVAGDLTLQPSTMLSLHADRELQRQRPRAPGVHRRRDGQPSPRHRRRRTALQPALRRSRFRTLSRSPERSTPAPTCPSRRRFTSCRARSPSISGVIS